MMDVFRYPVSLEPEADGGFVALLRDFGGATQGADRADALAAAEDYIGTWIEMLIEEGRDIPAPSDVLPGEVLVPAPLDVAALALLYSRMRAQGISNVELARRLGKDEKAVRRMLDPRHGTRLSAYRDAFRALGVGVELRAA